LLFKLFIGTANKTQTLNNFEVITAPQQDRHLEIKPKAKIPLASNIGINSQLLLGG
jgi:hypothetical protein